MKKRPLLSTAMRGSRIPDFTPPPLPTAKAGADRSPASSSTTPGPMVDRPVARVAVRQDIDTLPGIYADAMKGATLVMFQAWRQSLDLQLRLSAYMLKASRRVMAGQSLRD